jgi:hypothetical protein
MKAAVRFAEYSMTGGIFWVSFIIYLTLLNLPLTPDSLMANVVKVWAEWGNNLGTLFDPLGQTIESGVIALVVVAIFLTGLALDLVSTRFFTPFEMYFFKKYFADCNISWLENLIAEHEPYLANDFEKFKSEPVLNWKNRAQLHRQKIRYEKIRGLLLSYLYICSSDSRLDEVLDLSSLWRTTRSLSMSMVILAVLCTSLVANAEAGGVASNWLLAIVFILPIVLCVLSIYISRSTFLRFCALLSAMIYMTYKLNCKS